MKTIVLKSSPSTLALYLRATMARKSGVVPSREMELASVVLRGVRADMKELAAYREVCGFSSSGRLPLTFPFVLALPLQMELLLLDASPFPLIGLVHVRNDITHYQWIADTDKFDIECSLIGPRRAGKGLEFDFHTKLLVGGVLAWECISTMLQRTKGGNPELDEVRANQALSFTPSHDASWEVNANIGRRYARASGDINPIHLHDLTAKMLGFPRAIAHGMWSKARCVAELESQLPKGPFRLSVSFKLPIFLPATVRFQHASQGSDLTFFVKDKTGKKPHLAGFISPLD